MIDLVDLVIASLAAWRLAFLITNEDGPFDIALKVRILFGGYDYDENNRPLTSRGRGIKCIQCVSFWMGLLAGVIVLLGWGHYLLPLAIAGLALYIHRLVRRE